MTFENSAFESQTKENVRTAENAGHDMEKVEKQAATAAKEGNSTYWFCDKCNIFHNFEITFYSKYVIFFLLIFHPFSGILLQYFQFDFSLHPALHLQNIIASFHRKILKLTRLILSKKSQVYGTEVSQYNKLIW